MWASEPWQGPSRLAHQATCVRRRAHAAGSGGTAGQREMCGSGRGGARALPAHPDDDTGVKSTPRPTAPHGRFRPHAPRPPEQSCRPGRGKRRASGPQAPAVEAEQRRAARSLRLREPRGTPPRSRTQPPGPGSPPLPGAKRSGQPTRAPRASPKDLAVSGSTAPLTSLSPPVPRDAPVPGGPRSHRR